MTAETEFFFTSARSVSRIEGLEISHPSFSRTFYLVRNPNPWMAQQPLGHGGGVVVTYQYCPLRLRPMASRGDLDYGVTIDLGDLGEIIPAEIDAIVAASTTGIRPQVRYRAWRSDQLNAPMTGPIRLQVDQITRAKDGATFDALAPYLNLSKTGSLYTVERFEMLAALR